MKLSNFFTLLALVLTTTTISIQAQTTILNTVPEGIATLNIPATGAGSVTSYFSLPLTSDPTYTGAVSALTATTITVADSPAPWTSGNLSTAAAPYFVKFLSGVETGRVIKVTGNTTNTLTLDTSDNSLQTVALNASGFSVAVGDTFEVFPADTLASIFGSSTLVGSTSIFTADTVSIYNTTSSRFQAYYFNTSSGYWELSGTSTNANSTIIYPYGAFTITRRGSEPQISLVLMGRVPEVPILTKTTGNNVVVYTSTNYPADMTLSQIQLGPNWAMTTSSFTADTLTIWDGVRFDSYYQLPDTTWRKAGSPSTDVSSFVLPEGTVVSLLHRASTPTGASSFLSSVMPYSLN